MQNVLFFIFTIITFSFSIFPTLNTSWQEEHSVDSQFQSDLAGCESEVEHSVDSKFQSDLTGCESEVEHSVDSQFRDNSTKFRNPN